MEINEELKKLFIKTLNDIEDAEKSGDSAAVIRLVDFLEISLSCYLDREYSNEVAILEKKYFEADQEATPDNPFTAPFDLTKDELAYEFAKRKLQALVKLIGRL